MLAKVDRAFSWALIILSAGHGFLGTLLSSDLNASSTVWSFSGSIAAWLIAAMNLLRAGRPDDKAIAWVALAGTFSWLGLMFWLAHAAQMWGDIRIWLFVFVSVGLGLFSWRTLRGINK